MGNIAEGFEASSSDEFKRYLGMAKASNGEVRSYLILILELGYYSEEEAELLLAANLEIRKILIGLRNSVPKMRFRSSKELRT